MSDEQAQPPRTHALRVLAVLAIAFGLLTLKEGGTVLFGAEAAWRAAGDVVPFVVWFNFAAGLAYVAAGAGLWWRRRWAAWLAIAIALATAIVFTAFGVHALHGGAHEQRTVIAMTLRLVVWTAIGGWSWRVLLNARSRSLGPASSA